MKILALNRRAKFDYELLEEFNAGLVLKGYEVKSIKAGHISLKNSFITAKEGELYLTNAHVSPYQYANLADTYDPTRARKLLLQKKELKHLLGKSTAQGLTMVPLSIYNKKGLIKLKFCLAKGKKRYDKRQAIKKREDQRRMRRHLDF